MMSTMTGTPNQFGRAVRPYQAGCHVDGDLHGSPGAEIVWYAMVLTWGAEHASTEDAQFWSNLTREPDFMHKWGDDGYQYLSDMADEAMTWANEHVAPEGMAFGWYEGSVFLHGVAWWEAIG